MAAADHQRCRPEHCRGGVKSMINTSGGPTQWNEVMAAMLLTLIPPVVVVLVMQRAFVRGRWRVRNRWQR